MRLARALVTETGAVVGGPLFAPGIPLFSARLLAMDECGSLRRDGVWVVTPAFAGGDAVLEGVDLVGGEEGGDCGGGRASSLPFSFLLGGSLIRRASLWW